MHHSIGIVSLDGKNHHVAYGADQGTLMAYFEQHAKFNAWIKFDQQLTTVQALESMLDCEAFQPFQHLVFKELRKYATVEQTAQAKRAVNEPAPRDMTEYSQSSHRFLVFNFNKIVPAGEPIFETNDFKTACNFANGVWRDFNKRHEFAVFDCTLQRTVIYYTNLG